MREEGHVFEEQLLLDWFIQLTTAVHYIHQRRILHRDLKTRCQGACSVGGGGGGGLLRWGAGSD